MTSFSRHRLYIRSCQLSSNKRYFLLLRCEIKTKHDRTRDRVQRSHTHHVQSSDDICSCNRTEGLTRKLNVKKRTSLKFFKHLTKNKIFLNLNATWINKSRNYRSFSKTSAKFLDIFNPLNIDVKKLASEINRRQGHARIDNQFHVEYVCCKFLVNPRQHCSKHEDFDGNFIIFMVKSLHSNWSRRQAIRQTWGNETYLRKYKLRTIFILGLPSVTMNDHVAKEISIYDDILLLSLDDTYFNNTFKTIAIFHWLSKYCRFTTKYAMMVDDDYYVSPEGLVNMLLNLPTSLRNSQLYIGTTYEKPKPHKTNDMFYVSESEYPYDYYPPFTPTGSVIMSMDFVQDVHIAMHFVLPFKFDDVYIGIIAHFLNVSPQNMEGIYVSKNVMLRRVRFSTVIACHGFTHDELLTAWQHHRIYKKPIHV